MKLIVGLLFALTAQAADYTFTLNPGVCQSSVQPPSYYCSGYMQDVTGNTGEWSFNTTVKSDNTFNTGFLSGYFPYGTDWILLDTTNIAGTFANNTFTGSGSGTLSSGAPYTVNFSNFTLGTVRCGGYKGTVRYCKAITSGTITYHLPN